MFEEKNQTVSAKIKNPEKGHGWSTGLVHGFCLRAYGFSFAHIKHEAFPYGLRAYENSMVIGFFFVAHMKTQAELEISGRWPSNGYSRQ